MVNKMNAHSKLILILFFFSSSILVAQLKEFVIIPEEPPALPAVFPSYSKKAALIIHSSIPTLKFVSNTGGIVDNLSRPNEGKYILILEPENQYITVKTAGFREVKFPVTGLKPRDVLYYSIEQKQEVITAQGRLILNSIPSGAQYQVAGFPISGTTPADFPIAMGNYKIVFSKPGYNDKSIIVNVGKGAVVSKTVELDLAMEIISNPILTEIKEIRTVGGLLSGARIEITPDALNVIYNLNGNVDDEYNVTLKLKSRLNPDYEYPPKLLSGDVGEGSFAGSGRKIIWKINDEMPGGFDTEGLYLELSAETIGGSSWLWWTGGILAIGGGAAAYFLLGKKPGETTTPTVEIPTPPIRP